MRSKLIVGNWKMNGSRAANAALLSGIVAGLRRCAGAACAVCVPAPYLQQCEELLTGTPVAWGAQDVSVHGCGAYTGEVCAHDAGRVRLPLRDRRPLRAPRLPSRRQRAGGEEGAGRAGRRA